VAGTTGDEIVGDCCSVKKPNNLVSIYEAARLLDSFNCTTLSSATTQQPILTLAQNTQSDLYSFLQCHITLTSHPEQILNLEMGVSSSPPTSKLPAPNLRCPAKNVIRRKADLEPFATARIKTRRSPRWRSRRISSSRPAATARRRRRRLRECSSIIHRLFGPVELTQTLAGPATVPSLSRKPFRILVFPHRSFLSASSSTLHRQHRRTNA